MSNLFLLSEETDKDNKNYISSISNVKNSNQDAKYNDDIKVSTVYKIYAQSIEKMIELIKDIIKAIEDKNVTSDNLETFDNSVYKKIAIIESIISEFSKLFSTVKNKDLKQIYNHLYMKFYDIDVQIKLFYIKQETKYGENCLKLCEHLLKIFRTLEQQSLNLDSPK